MEERDFSRSNTAGYQGENNDRVRDADPVNRND